MALKDNPVHSPVEQEQLHRWKQLTELALPALAREQHWPIRLDHCFKRITLDYAFSDVWYKHLARPAERHLVGAPLERALACAEELAAQGLPVLRERNAASLLVRGKKLPRSSP